MRSKVLKSLQYTGKQVCLREHGIQSTLLVHIVKTKSMRELEGNMNGLKH